MVRVLEPEILDGLLPSDPRASRARRDLRLVNALMGNARILARALRQARPPILRMVEIGAGDGALMLRVASKLGDCVKGAEITLVDRSAAVAAGTLQQYRDIGWRATAVDADAAHWLEQAPGDVDAVVANLFLHHFDDAKLAQLLSLAAQRTRLFVACEPRRSRIALAGSRMLRLAGCSTLTCHDAVISVNAGFRNGELTAAWPRSAGWVLSEGAQGPFSHAFVARRQ